MSFPTIRPRLGRFATPNAAEASPFVVNRSKRVWIGLVEQRELGRFDFLDEQMSRMVIALWGHLEHNPGHAQIFAD